MARSLSPRQPDSRRRTALIELAKLDKSDLAQALRRIAEVVARTLDVERVSYWELDEHHTAISCVVLYQRTSGTWSHGGQLHANDFPAYFEALLASRTIVAHDAWTHPQTSEFAEAYFQPNNITSMLDVPVWLRGVIAGVLCCEHVGPARTWTNDDQDFALSIGNVVSVAIESGERRRVEEGYAMLARATDEVFWDWDIATGVLHFSSAIESRLGFPAGSVKHTINWWLDLVHVDDRVRVKTAVQDALRSGATEFVDKYRLICGDGRIATILDRGFIARDEHGVPVRMVGSMLDITERMSLEARLAVSERLASIGRLAAGVAHEINNPLTYIMSNLAFANETLRDRGADCAGLVAMLEDALEGAERVRRIVSDLKSLSRLPDEEVEPTNVHDVIDSSIKVAWNEVRHRAQLERDLRPVPRVAVDRARLGQVILNLLINAVQAVPEGAADQHRIRIATYAADRDQVIIEIADSGPGVPPELRDRIFEPFFTTKPVGAGTGLGLSICESIVSKYGGSLVVDSAPEGGCLMRVTLPAATGPAVPRNECGAPRPANRQRVLLVDDDPQVRRALARMLATAHDVITVEDGPSALEHLLEGPPIDVILCDLQMPRMSGMELLEQIQTVAPAYVERLVFMTGGAFSERACALVASGRHVVLEKPLDKSTVLAAVRDAGARVTPSRESRSPRAEPRGARQPDRIVPAT